MSVDGKRKCNHFNPVVSSNITRAKNHLLQEVLDQ
jgi:hypothetical protein